MNCKRLTLLCGHYGSGKTNVAVNLAFALKNRQDKVSVADLDIVNPYFRTKDSKADFEAAGIRLICSEYANTNVDIPALPADMYCITDPREGYFILDIGGDDRGAYALGRIVPDILRENNYDMLMVVNCYRPLTPDATSTLEVMAEIERACGLPFTGIVNNSNLGALTSAEDVLSTLRYAREVEALSGKPLRFTAVEASLYQQLQGKIENLFPLQLQKKLI
ncbi:MAG: hypothetical protein IKY33_02560 [Clostridia bacterium]|nr:hypothetical protein [Clostridia bacterium]